MSLILLADDSPHAQRMGAQILGEEGYEVVSAAHSDAALAQLAKVDPDLVIADVSLPGKGGLALCRYVRDSHPYTRVILTAGMLEPFDEAAARESGCAALLRKPFEATQVVETVRPLIEEASRVRLGRAEKPAQDVEAIVQRVIEAELPRFVREVRDRVIAEIRGERPK